MFFKEIDPMHLVHALVQVPLPSSLHRPERLLRRLPLVLLLLLLLLLAAGAAKHVSNVLKQQIPFRTLYGKYALNSYLVQVLHPLPLAHPRLLQQGVLVKGGGEGAGLV